MGPGGVQIVEDVDAARVLDELGGEVVAAGVGALLLGHVKNEHRDGFLARHRLLGGGDLALHPADDLLGLVLHLEDASQVIEILIYVLQISPQLVALDGGQGHNSVLGEGVMFRVIFLTEGAGAAVDKVGSSARMVSRLGLSAIWGMSSYSARYSGATRVLLLAV